MKVHYTVLRWIFLVAVCCSSSLFGSQGERYELAAENNKEIPITTREAYLVSLYGGQFELHLTVKNNAKLAVREFTVEFSFGPVILGYEVEPGEVKRITIPLPESLSSRLRQLITNGVLSNGKISISELRWSEKSATRMKVDLAALVQPGVPLQAFVTEDALAFPREPSMAVAPDERNVVTYASTHVEIYNPSHAPLRKISFKLDGFADEKWVDIWNRGLFIVIEPGKRRSIELRIPLEVLRKGVKQHFDKYRIVITGADY